MPHKAPLTIVYATRFGTTRYLAEVIAAQVSRQGLEVLLYPVEPDLKPPQEGPLLLLTAIIWDQALKEMRLWLKRNREEIAPRLLGVGVVCGSAGVRPGGGRSYLKRLVNQFPAPPPFCFTLSGRIPPRGELHLWEYALLRLFSMIMGKPQLFSLSPDAEKARALGDEMARFLLLGGEGFEAAVPRKM